ncbi:MAG: PepSY domain-containing protein [Limisphaerales bacterium]
MKTKMIVCSALAISLLAGCMSEKSEHHDKQARQSKLMAEAKVSQNAARQTALAKVPGGIVKEGELEKEHGKLIWSFDVATPDSKDITEVHVDAVTGDVVSVGKESAESEAKEAGEKDEDNDKDKN